MRPPRQDGVRLTPTRSARPTAVALAAVLAACAGPPAEAAVAEPAAPEPAAAAPARETFAVAGRRAFLIRPPAARTPQPWLLYAPTLPRYPDRNEDWLFERLLAGGVAVAGVDVGESYGGPAGVAAYAALHAELVARGLSRRPVLLGRSRGGLMTLNFAAAHPDKVAAFAGIYPVCDLRSYPGLERACGAYGLSAAALERDLAAHNPIDRLAPLARAGVALFAIHGDRDDTVPLAANSGALAARYRELGGDVELVVAPGQGHSGWAGFFRSERLLAFVLAHAR